ncbi:3-hydroxybutyryl-CoA dehydrogenase [Paenibacillus sp. NEAU-GSW1]|uniref:3-hydroxybutyryl-CoA dehydrogenase n=1 Tax=Paenibacillus sp. NEAU-GSW1 TaxID=2682486 RepID=UPI0012E32437|nr:3-hydroxybutyryl-CoA dehydrogenase [Paenibacillus sp. NEAU-GSW1]MUT68716.1 3-hydroxybutyryl-CoA dehydrogenase [Paenibacillus sp. NEAU-GSW1]
MNAAAISGIAVLGAGQMGGGIAQTMIACGLNVTLYDIDSTALANRRASIDKAFERLVAKGRMSEEERIGAIARLSLATDLELCREAELVIEAAPEKLRIKQLLFAELDRLCEPQTILATNTSSLSVTEIAAATNRPDRVIGIHFMNPVPVMALVEIIRGLATSDDTYVKARALIGAIGKTPVTVRDFPGFVSNRVLMPMINEAIYTVYEGVATPEDVDQVMQLGMSHPMGPLALADFIGLDTCLSIMETLHDGFGDSKYRPCPLLRAYVAAGWLGRKAGKGFYVYNDS